MKAKVSKKLAEALSDKETSKKLGKALATGNYGETVTINNKEHTVKRFDIKDLADSEK